MNQDQLKRGNEITQRIKHLKEQKAKFENARAISGNACISKQTNAEYYGVDFSLVDIEILKTLTIKRISDEISELENEFNKL